MKPIITASDIDKMFRQNGSVDIPAGAALTPSARDRLRELQNGGGIPYSSASPAPQKNVEPSTPDYTYYWEQRADPKTPEEIQAFFHSPEIEELKRRMVDIGRRMWERDYTDGNGGNLTIRVGENMVLCTPTLISKGFMKPEDMCLVDLEGNQLAGTRKRTSEVLTHIAIMKRQPKARACCHAHPPHATAFAVAKVRPPTCLIPEAEVFLGEIGIAVYQTPGTPENAKAVGDAAVDHQCVLMLNHGVITWGKDIEDSYWKMENADAYCKTVWVASSLGRELEPITGAQAKELITLRQALGMDDKRSDLKECELCDNSDFRPGFVGQVSSDGQACQRPEAESGEPDPAIESVVQEITNQILKSLNS